MVKLKNLLNRKLALTVYVWFCVLMVVENPMFQSLNLMFSSSQLTTTQYNNGLTFQGSCLVNTVVQNVQATNSTSGELVNAYQVNITVFNFMSLMLLLLPFIIFIYSEILNNKISITKTKIIMKKKGVKG